MPPQNTEINSSRKSKTHRKKIIIIGAGIAGLAACSRLVEYGFDASILEARNRCGGRIWVENKREISISLGASWIHGVDGNPITQLANAVHANMAPFNFNNLIIFDRHGAPISDNDKQKFELKFTHFLQQAKELACQSKQDISLADALASCMQSATFSALEQDLFQRKLAYFQGYIGADYEFLSARHWDHEEAWPGENCFLMPSYQPVIDGLLRNCPVRLNTTVTEINTRANDVEVVTENALFYADAVLITLPLGVLKKKAVTFNPPLPADKQHAIEHLGMGLFNITTIKFSKAFWPKDAQAFFFTQCNKPIIPLFFNLHYSTQQPVLVGYSGGERARQLENYSDAELIETVMTELKKHFGSQAADPEFYFTTRWSNDPYSYGSYSYIPPGGAPADYAALAKSVSDRLFFAGEATSEKYPATTHGAYLSGIREAEAIIDVFRKT